MLGILIPIKEEGRAGEYKNGDVPFSNERFWKELLGIEAIYQKKTDEEWVMQELVQLRFIEGWKKGRKRHGIYTAETQQFKNLSTRLEKKMRR